MATDVAKVNKRFESHELLTMDRVKIDLSEHLENTAIFHYRQDGDDDNIKYKDLLKQILKIGVVLAGEELSKTESTTIGMKKLIF